MKTIFEKKINGYRDKIKKHRKNKKNAMKMSNVIGYLSTGCIIGMFLSSIFMPLFMLCIILMFIGMYLSKNAEVKELRSVLRLIEYEHCIMLIKQNRRS